MNLTCLHRLIWLVMALLLQACGSGPPPRLYLLDADATVNGERIDGLQSDGIGLLGMGEVTLPGYADDARIASLLGDGSVQQIDGHRWADSPERSITQLLADRLRFHGKSTVLIEPWPRDYTPKARIEVAFDRLLREPLGGVDMAGQLLLLSGDGRAVLTALPFQIIHYGQSEDYAVFFENTSRAIDDLAIVIIRSLLESESPL